MSKNKKPQRRGLSRGLGALLGNVNSVSEKTPEPDNAEEKKSVADSVNNSGLATLSVERLQRGRYQPRSDMHTESLQELAESIKKQGILQPIVVRPIGGEGRDTRYEIIAGERRWRAAQIAELQEIPVIIKDVADEDAIAMALIENIQRENLNPLEEALALQRLIDEFELTHEEAAQAVGRKRASVSNLLRLLELDGSVKNLVRDQVLSMGHARAILALGKDKQLMVANEVVAKGLSVRATESLIRGLQQPKSQKPKVKPSKDADIARLEEDLREKLGASVAIEDKKGKGKLVIKYTSLDELDGILNKIG